MLHVFLVYISFEVGFYLSLNFLKIEMSSEILP